jgi:hypothetical protein
MKSNTQSDVAALLAPWNGPYGGLPSFTGISSAAIEDAMRVAIETTWQAKQYYQLNRTAVWASTNVTQANSAFYRSLMLTLIESNLYGISSGSVRQVNIRGGADQ